MRTGYTHWREGEEGRIKNCLLNYLLMECAKRTVKDMLRI